jgi:hypothetical protein
MRKDRVRVACGSEHVACDGDRVACDAEKSENAASAWPLTPKHSSVTVIQSRMTPQKRKMRRTRRVWREQIEK